MLQTRNRFIEDNDWAILMDVPRIDGTLFDRDELAALKAAGINVTMMFVNNWDDLEYEMGRFNWRPIDDYVNRAQAVGMKVIIPACTAAMTWAPDDWYLHTKAGVQRGVLSPWNPCAQQYLLDHMSRIIDRYTGPGVVVVNTQLTHGETLLLNEAAWYDPFAIASYERQYGMGRRPCMNVDLTENWYKDSLFGMLRAQAAVLGEQYEQLLFTALHPAIAQFPGLYGNGCQWYQDLLQMYRASFPEHQVLWVLYTYVQWVHLWQPARELQAALNLHVYGGAEYCEGLAYTTQRAINNGCSGQFLGPCHPYTGHARLEPWMLEAIEKARGLWEAAR